MGTYGGTTDPANILQQDQGRSCTWLGQISQSVYQSNALVSVKCGHFIQFTKVVTKFQGTIQLGNEDYRAIPLTFRLFLDFSITLRSNILCTSPATVCLNRYNVRWIQALGSVKISLHLSTPVQPRSSGNASLLCCRNALFPILGKEQG